MFGLLKMIFHFFVYFMEQKFVDKVSGSSREDRPIVKGRIHSEGFFETVSAVSGELEGRKVALREERVSDVSVNG